VQEAPRRYGEIGRVPRNNAGRGEELLWRLRRPWV
jgi:hypothetical protein